MVPKKSEGDSPHCRLRARPSPRPVRRVHAHAITLHTFPHPRHARPALEEAPLSHAQPSHLEAFKLSEPQLVVAVISFSPHLHLTLSLPF